MAVGLHDWQQTRPWSWRRSTVSLTVIANTRRQPPLRVIVASDSWPGGKPGKSSGPATIPTLLSRQPYRSTLGACCSEWCRQCGRGTRRW